MEKFKPVNNDQLFLLPPSVEDFVPADHLARVIKEVVETIDVSAIESRYSHLGQKSYHPHLLLKLLFYGYSIGIRSGRKLAAACESDTAFMYLANMYRPDFRTINDFRKDNIEFVQTAFVHIVQLCKALGMCKAGLLIIDSTKLKANASADKSKTREQYQQWLERIESDIKGMLQEAEQIDKNEDAQYGNNRGDELPEELRSKQKLKDKIQQALQLIKKDKDRINLTDNEAKFMKGNGTIDIHYSCQTAVTEDGIIVSAYTTNQCSDRTQTVQVAAKAESISGQIYTDLLADSGYASYDNYEEFEKQNKNIYIPDQQMNMETEKAQNPYHRNNFIYNEEKDCFICPENKILPFYSTSIHKRFKAQTNVYICKDCPSCEKQSLCTKGKHRQICIEQREWIRKKIRNRLNSIEGKIKYLTRMRIESVFGNIKHNLNYVHLYLQGIQKTTAEWQLICIGHNLKKIHHMKMA
ncbi:IS1182 family transposase [Candidatus Parcubacteria bacterium]|nr:IS1182 family transposase [Candidatus Parcubacteria bacterium]